MNQAMTYLRGQVWFYDEHTTMTQFKLRNSNCIAKSRPVLIFNANKRLEKCNHVTVIPISSSSVGPNDFFFFNRENKKCKVCIDQITTVDADRLTNYMYALPLNMIKEIEVRVMNLLGIPLKLRDRDKDDDCYRNKSYPREEVESSENETTTEEASTIEETPSVIEAPENAKDPVTISNTIPINDTSTPIMREVTALKTPKKKREEDVKVEVAYDPEALQKITALLGREPEFPDKKGQYYKWSATANADLVKAYYALSKNELMSVYPDMKYRNLQKRVYEVKGSV